MKSELSRTHKFHESLESSKFTCEEKERRRKSENYRAGQNSIWKEDPFNFIELRATPVRKIQS